jgi:hypothetical protein
VANRQGLEDLDRLRRTAPRGRSAPLSPPSQAYRDNYDRIFRDRLRERAFPEEKPAEEAVIAAERAETLPPCSCGRCIACVPRNPLFPAQEKET